MKTIGERVAYARESNGWNQTELARRVGLKPQAIQQIESGETKRSRYLPDIASATGFALKWIMTGEGIERSQANLDSGPPIRRYPLISWVAAGRWCEATEPYQPGDAEKWLLCPANCGPQTFALRVRGISMEPRFREGQIIFIDPGREAINGSYVVVRLEETQEVTFKKLVVEGDRKLLKAENPAWPQQIIEIDHQTTICGVLVFAGEEF